MLFGGVSNNSSFAIKENGTLWSWGGNVIGQLGTGDKQAYISPVQIGNEKTWQSIFSGFECSTIAMKKDGTVWSWGNNTFGQLGLNSTLHRSSPVQIGSSTSWNKVCMGQTHVLAIKDDNTIWSWGSNYNGELGQNDTVHRSDPTQIGVATNWTRCFAGKQISAATNADGELFVWGLNDVGQLGKNNTTNLYVPTKLGTENTWDNIGVGSASIIVTKNIVEPAPVAGSMFVWSNNSNGSAGIGFPYPLALSSPAQIRGGGDNWLQITGRNAIKSDGTLWTWGDLVNGLTTNYGIYIQEPEQLMSDKKFQDVAYNRVTIRGAVENNGRLWIWASGNTNYYLGNVTPTNYFVGKTWKKLALGDGYIVAIKDDGTLWTWGKNGAGGATSISNNGIGRLGDNSFTSRWEPGQTVSKTKFWSSVDCGYFHTAAIKLDGTLWIWGSNTDGQLGDGTIIDKSSPIQTIAGGNDWKQVSCGAYNTAAIKDDGTLWTWGENVFFNGLGGFLGDNTTVNRSSPVQINGIWKMVRCDQYSMSAIKIDGTLWSWGNFIPTNSPNTYISTPVQIGTQNNWISLGARDFIGSAIFDATLPPPEGPIQIPGLKALYVTWE